MTIAPGRSEKSPILGLVYAARRFGSPEFRYVGITTKTTEVRRRQHLKSAKSGRKTPFYDWLRTMETDEDVYFQPMELITGDELEELGAAERRWIAELRANGHRLLNLSEGGLGPRGHVWTAEQRKAAGDRARGRKRINVPTGPDHPSWGQRRTDEQRARWSAQRKGMNAGAQNANFGKFGSEHPSYGHTMSDEARAKLSDMRRGENNPNFGKTASAETRAKMSAVRKGRAMPSSIRSAHTRHHTNKGVFKETCRHCVDDMQETTETRKDT